jgi:hypothetical protein
MRCSFAAIKALQLTRVLKLGIIEAMQRFCCGLLRTHIMQQAKLSTVKPGEYIKRKAESSTVYIKGAYDRATKSFSCTDTNDICREISIKANKPVFVGFTY